MIALVQVGSIALLGCWSVLTTHTAHPPGCSPTTTLLPAGAYEHLERVTKKLIDGILAAAKETGHAMCGGNISGMFGFFFCEGPIKSFEDAKAAGGYLVRSGKIFEFAFC